MEQQTIRFRIRPDGRVEELVEGVRGLGCEQLTERIEAKLGAVQQRQSTAEAFQPQDQVQGQVQTLSQPLANPVPLPSSPSTLN
jgi:hypothetical protein